MQNILKKINKKVVIAVIIIFIAISFVVGYSYLESAVSFTTNIKVDALSCNEGSLYERISCQAYPDGIKSKNVLSVTGINFENTSSPTNGKGVYAITSTLNDSFPIYYYRGEVNNNLKFNNICWKIIRTTSDGKIKLIYNGEINTEGVCSNNILATDIFNENDTSFTDSLFQFGERYEVTLKEKTEDPILYSNDVSYNQSTNLYTLLDPKEISWSDYEDIAKSNHYTCLSADDECSKINYITFMDKDKNYSISLSGGLKITDVFPNNKSNNSNVKNILDEWLTNHLKDNQLLDNTVFCGEKYENLGLFDKDNTILNNNLLFKSEEINCDNSYTLPIGLITKKEAILAGIVKEKSNSYLVEETGYWTMTPDYFDGYTAYINSINKNLTSTKATETLGIRPVITIKDTQIKSGDGSIESPFTID